jgi:hypothetical protein
MDFAVDRIGAKNINAYLIELLGLTSHLPTTRLVRKRLEPAAASRRQSCGQIPWSNSMRALFLATPILAGALISNSVIGQAGKTRRISNRGPR